MRHAYERSELLKLTRRYVTPGQRYLKLGGSPLGMSGRERGKFTRKLGKAASAINPRELETLLNGGWRERTTAAWLIAVAGRTEFRERLGELLLASEVPFAGEAYCVALATFGAPADADLLGAYLDRYLLRPDLDYDQAAALGALLLLDARLGASQAARFLVSDGLWQQWVDGPPTKDYDAPGSYREFIGQLCVVADESARHCTARSR
ncbi:DUF6000 family protein [Streptomyces sp. NPDC007991]|uniref:DUF6000 family protein n=1 Tax=Streptomyces sp. NPDC007991 TaxID=3364803 RepID=UPI0036E2C769